MMITWYTTFVVCNILLFIFKLYAIDVKYGKGNLFNYLIDNTHKGTIVMNKK